MSHRTCRGDHDTRGRRSRRVRRSGQPASVDLQSGSMMAKART